MSVRSIISVLYLGIVHTIRSDTISPSNLLFFRHFKISGAFNFRPSILLTYPICTFMLEDSIFGVSILPSELSIETVSISNPESYNAIANTERRSEEHTSELQSRRDLVCRLLL